MKEPERRGDGSTPVRRTNWTTVALIGGLLFLVLLVAFFATNRNSNPDKLTNSQVATSTAPSREKLCASGATYDLIKSELFRRAAQLRGADQAAFDRISSSAVVRMENPVMESEDGATQALNCSGSLSLDLPPGVAVSGGRRTLMSDVDYTVEPAADGSGTAVLIHNADAIIRPLATLTKAEPPARPSTTEINNQTAIENSQAAAPPAAAAPATPPPRAQPPVATRTSTGCPNGISSGAALVCSDARLTALDRAMTSEYARAFAVAPPEMRDTLRQTARRFHAYRDRCVDRQCVADAYSDRIREIRDIVEGRWQPPQ